MLPDPYYMYGMQKSGKLGRIIQRTSCGVFVIMKVALII